MVTRQVEHTFILTVTLPTAGLAANNQTAVQFQGDPTIAAVPAQSVPAAESWILEDLYVSSSQTNDGLLVFYRNGLQIAYRSGNINGLVVTNTARPIPTPFMYQGNDIITAVFINTSAVATSASSAVNTIFAKFRRFTPY